jgi:hypothetical protein
MIKLLVEYGADLDAATTKGWTPLSYSKAKGKYGATEEKGIYPEVGPQPEVCRPSPFIFPSIVFSLCVSAQTSQWTCLNLFHCTYLCIFGRQ